MPFRILCISPLFAPSASAEGFCANKMAEALRGRGASVTVLVRHDIFDGIGEDGSRVWDAVRSLAVNVPRPAETSRLAGVAAALYFQTPIYARWVASVLQKAESLHRDVHFDLVYSRSIPMVSHVAGFWCAKKLKLPWIANLNDPWSFSLYRKSGTLNPSGLKLRNLLFWLRRTLRHADLVTYPCERLHRFHVRLAGFDHRAQIIPHIGRPPARQNPRLPATTGQFRLVHAGMLGVWDKTNRSALALLHGWRMFLDSCPSASAHSRLVLVGPEDQLVRKQVGDLRLDANVEFTGRVDYETSLDYIGSASACVLLEAFMDEGIFLPSKLADYVACGKPVLAVSPPVGTVADLAVLGALIRVDHDAEALRNAIASLYAHFQFGTLPARAPSQELVRRFQPQTVADQFLSACRSAVLRRQARNAGWKPNSRAVLDCAAASSIHEAKKI